MKMIPKVKYPLDTARFDNIRQNGMTYVDKTFFIHKLLENESKYYFLARPRRFGKSLFLDTMAEYFLGNRKLFEGLAIDKLQPEEWQSFPVLRFSMAGTRFIEGSSLESHISNQLKEYEEKFLIKIEDKEITIRFSNLIRLVNDYTGKKVVILIDEYDAPLASTIDKPELQEKYRETLQGFYSNLKEKEEFVHFCFLTGVTRYGKVSIFSGLNNLQDITFNDRYAAICGITNEELKKYYISGIESLSLKKGLTINDTLELLKFHYDGYHFTESLIDIYNPYSINYALSEQKIKDYWCQSGTPTILAKSLMENDYDLKNLLDEKVEESELSNLSMFTKNPVPLFYQTGYLTLKAYNEETELFTLGYPNREVESATLKQILKDFADSPKAGKAIIVDMQRAFKDGKPEEFIKLLSAFLSGMPLDLRKKVNKYENYYHTIFYCLVKLIGLDISAEYATSEGYIDILIKTENYIYIIELKVNGNAEEAIKQIEEKHYCAPFVSDSRKIYKIGIGFSKETGTINSSLIQI